MKTLYLQLNCRKEKFLMKQHGNRFAAFFLALVMAVGVMILPAAASGSAPESVDRADKLASLGLFQGTNQGYQLDNIPNRIQGLVMLIRLLGLEDEALAYDEDSPFTDLTWGENYVAYAYDNGLTQGTGKTTFSPNTALNAKSYVTFLLRALGYDDAAGDFSWNTVLSFAASQGILLTAEAAEKLESVTINRGDMVDLSYAALTCKVKDGSQTLAERLVADGVFTQAAGETAGVLGDGAGWTYTYTPYDNSTVTYAQKSLAGVTAHVLTVNTASSRVKVETALVNNTVGATANFKDIVNASGALAVINGNFFASYDAFKAPIGHVMVDGELLYGNSGTSALGIYADGSVAIGRPGIFTRLTTPSGGDWSIYEVNTASQGSEFSVLYTPAYGQSVAIKAAGSVMTVAGGKITDYRSVSAGSTVSIPANGYVAFMGTGFTSTNYYDVPVVGDAVTLSYYLKTDNGEPFSMGNLVSMVAGGPRLVQDGAIVTTLEPGFQEDRFTTAVSPRTAVGIDGSGKLLLVSVPGGATTQQMRELMLGLGCVDAINLDGGASCAMYYNGQYLATPGRQLTVTLQVTVS